MKKNPEMIATPYTAEEIAKRSPKPPAKKIKLLCPEMAQRKIRALDKFLADGDITLSQFVWMKQRVIDQMMGK
jgi:hypothetical protein